MKVDLGRLVPALSGWRLCYDGSECKCTICVQLPPWAEGLDPRQKVYLALYIAARAIMDYRLVAAMHVYAVKERVMLRAELLARAVRESRVHTTIPRAVVEECPYAWEAVLYKGILYAEQLLSLEKPVLVIVKPPEDERARQEIKALLEGEDGTRHAEGLIRELGGIKVAPWVYLIPRSKIEPLFSIVKSRSGTATVVALG